MERGWREDGERMETGRRGVVPSGLWHVALSSPSREIEVWLPPSVHVTPVTHARMHACTHARTLHTCKPSSQAHELNHKGLRMHPEQGAEWNRIGIQ
jgi:hypothetical protein